MDTTRKGVAAAAITFSLLVCAPALAQQQMTSQQVLEQIKKKQEEMLQQQLEQMQQLLQSQQTALERLRQQQEEERRKQEQQALLEKQKQQQEKTAEEKFEALKKAGIFQKNGLAGSNESGPDNQQISGEQFAAIVGDALGSFSAGAYANYLEAANSDPLVASPQIDLPQMVLFMLQGLNGVPGDNPVSTPDNDWAQQYIQAAFEKGLLPKTQNNEKKLRDDLINEASEAGGSDDGTGGGTDGDWSDYLYYPDSSFITPDALTADFLDPPGYGSATYNGVVVGTDSNGDGLTGTSTFDVNFAPSDTTINGAFVFDGDDHVKLNGIYDDGLELRAGGYFKGGSVDASDFDGNFYGPNAEEIGGDWSFNVTGGTAPGTASGQFAAKR